MSKPGDAQSYLWDRENLFLHPLHSELVRKEGSLAGGAAPITPPYTAIRHRVRLMLAVLLVCVTGAACA